MCFGKSFLAVRKTPTIQVKAVIALAHFQVRVAVRVIPEMHSRDAVQKSDVDPDPGRYRPRNGNQADSVKLGDSVLVGVARNPG